MVNAERFDSVKRALGECMEAAGFGTYLRETVINDTTRVYHWQHGSLTLRCRDTNRLDHIGVTNGY
jgi:hypothetical protein